MLPDLHICLSRGRSGGLVFPSLSELSTVCCDPHSQRLWHSQWSRNRYFFWNSLAFSMIQQILAIWSLVPLPFLKTILNICKFTVHVLLFTVHVLLLWWRMLVCVWSDRAGRVNKAYALFTKIQFLLKVTYIWFHLKLWNNPQFQT